MSSRSRDSSQFWAVRICSCRNQRTSKGCANTWGTFVLNKSWNLFAAHPMQKLRQRDMFRDLTVPAQRMQFMLIALAQSQWWTYIILKPHATSCFLSQFLLRPHRRSSAKSEVQSWLRDEWFMRSLRAINDLRRGGTQTRWCSNCCLQQLKVHRW